MFSGQPSGVSAPDPLLYSQRALISQGLAVTWDNPDISLFKGCGVRMHPLLAHCHLGLGRLYRRTGKRGQAQEHLRTEMYREMDMRFWLK